MRATSNQITLRMNTTPRRKPVSEQIESKWCGAHQKGAIEQPVSEGSSVATVDGEILFQKMNDGFI